MIPPAALACCMARFADLFPDNYFSVVTFSETLEHLPVERLNFVLAELARVTCDGGLLLMSSPNQASLENVCCS